MLAIQQFEAFQYEKLLSVGCTLQIMHRVFMHEPICLAKVRPYTLSTLKL